MKRILGLCAVLVFANHISLAQFEIQKGVVGGLQLGRWEGKTVSSSQWLTGYAVGAFAELSLPYGLAVRPEALYSVKGNIATKKYTGTQVVYSTTTQTEGYLEVPILLKYRPSLLEKISPYIEAGPSIAYLVDAKFSEESFFGTSSFTNDTAFPQTDIGVVVGVGVSFPQDSRGVLSFDVRYTIGQSTLDKKGKVNIQNNAIVFLISTAF